MRSRAGVRYVSRSLWLAETVFRPGELMAAYRSDQLKSGDVSLLIGLLGKVFLAPLSREIVCRPRVRRQYPVTKSCGTNCKG
jgi:hypothetical protein